MHIKLTDLKITLILFVITIASRIPLASNLLYHLDSVQYALGIDNYDVTVHQPHPPGYFVYVVLGKLVNSIVHDPNRTFVIISILFSGLTVAAIYLLGKELFEKQIALLAALLAITSPNLWFHGEIALNYIVEAFTSTAIALLCWKVYRGKAGYIWLLAGLLALAGGIRQNTPVFLLPLVLFSIRTLPVKKIVAALLLFAVVTLCWFIPMVSMTGGVGAYLDAFKELWLFNTGHNSVFEKGLLFLTIYSYTIFNFITLGIGGGIVLLCLNLYHLLRKKKFEAFRNEQALFITLWIAPAFLFYLLIFIHPANPGYILVILPALILLTAKSVAYMSEELGLNWQTQTYKVVSILLLATNLFIFFGTKYPATANEVREHDRKLSQIVAELKAYDSSRTALFVGSYIFFGFRQVMYYLPDFPVYEPSAGKGPHGELRKIFWGKGRHTNHTDKIVISSEITKFATLFLEDYRRKFDDSGITVKEVFPGAYIASGPIELVENVYPKMRGRVAVADNGGRTQSSRSGSVSQFVNLVPDNE